MSISPFKAHIDAFQADLNSKAGRTKSEVEALVGNQTLHKLSSNENALGPSPKALEAIQNMLPRLHEYGHRVDTPFREALSRLWEGNMHPDQFITANSGLEIIDLAARAFLEPGTTAIFSNPTFHVYEIFTQVNGAETVNVPLLNPDYSLDVDGILRSVDDRTRLIFMTNPNNPTGTMIPKEAVDAVVNGVPDHVVIVHDEVYWHFAETENFPFARDYVLAGKNVIGLHSFSKAYGLAGMRVGYGFSTPRIATYLQKLRRPFFINTLSMEGALAALEDVEHLEKSVALVKEEKAWLYAELSRLGMHFWPSHTNFILFKSPLPTRDFVARMLEKGVMVREGDNNGAPGCIRLTIGTRPSNEAFIEALEVLLTSLGTTA
ncbi:MAG: histidinol-phosphate transaminase [Bacteroidota bacterium]